MNLMSSIVLTLFLINFTIISIQSNRVDYDQIYHNLHSILTGNHQDRVPSQLYMDLRNDDEELERRTIERKFGSDEQSMIRPVGFMKKRSSIMLNRLKQAFGQDRPNEHLTIVPYGDEQRLGNDQGKGKPEPEMEAMVTSTMSPVMEASPQSGHLESLFHTKSGPRFMALKYDPLMVSTPENNSYRRKMAMSDDEKLMKCFFNPVSCF